MSKIEELLAVLDMSENEQFAFVLDIDIKRRGRNIESFGNADIAYYAFRLRDEVKCMEYWWNGVLAVYQYVQADFIEVHKKLVPEVSESGAALQWFANTAKPIHFIIAALIAKQQEKPDG